MVSRREDFPAVPGLGGGSQRRVVAWGSQKKGWRLLPWNEAAWRQGCCGSAGELRGNSSFAAQKGKKKMFRVRQDTRNRMEGSSWQLDVSGDRDEQKTVAD